MASLQDQLLKAGLADQKKAKAIRNEKHKQRKQQPKGTAQVNETENRARQAREEKAEHDRQLNLKRQQEADKKAIRAQIRQLVRPTGWIAAEVKPLISSSTTKRSRNCMWTTSWLTSSPAAGSPLCLLMISMR